MPKARRISLKPATAAILLAGSAVAGVAGGTAIAEINAPTPAPAIQAPAASAVSRAGGHATLADMVEDVGPSVVQVDARRGGETVATPFGIMRQRPQEALGSGFFIDAEGTLITNNHVVDGASSVQVTLNDGTQRRARVLGTDAKTDIAVLKVEGGGTFRPVQWGDSDSLRVGESVFAVGSPFGLGNSVTSGILSARGRELGAGPYDDFLQVDAAINSGNSGGPLFDAAGRVVGVNTAIYSPNGGNVGIGFAIPTRLAQRIATDIARKGSVTRGWVGVGLQELSPEIARILRLDEDRGALIAQVENGSPAESSGMQRGDVVRSFAGKPVEDGRDFARFVADAPVGSRVPVEIVRDGRRVKLNLQIRSERG